MYFYCEGASCKTMFWLNALLSLCAILIYLHQIQFTIYVRTCYFYWTIYCIPSQRYYDEQNDSVSVEVMGTNVISYHRCLDPNKLPFYMDLCIDEHFIFFLTLSFIFTSFREQDEAYINSLRWSALVGLEPAYTRM